MQNTISQSRNHFLCRWSNAELPIIVPEELAGLLSTYLRRAHKFLCGNSYPYVFVDKKGRHMEDPAKMTDYWRYLLARMGSETFFPPHR